MFSQQPRLLSIDSPLGKDTLLLTRLEGEEAISSLFSFEIEMYSLRETIAPAEIVGKNVTLKLMKADDQGLKTDSHTVINGYVRQFRGDGSQLHDLRCYSAEVVPWLWFLTQTSDSKVFQHKDIRQIASEVFAANGFTDFEFRLIGQHPVREYCVQYQESDFTFLSRLFEEEGIYYFFKHSEGQHILVLADHSSAPETCEENQVSYRTGSLSPHHIHSWSHQHAFRTGRYAKRDYDFKKPPDHMLTGVPASMEVPGVTRYEHYLYPGRYDNKGFGENLTKLRIEHDEALHDHVLGKGICRTFRTGHTFDLTRHDDTPGELNTYLLISIQHDASDYSYTSRDEETRGYENRFVCMPASRVYRPPLKTGWPKMLGPQHAVIVGPAGEEIYTDEYGRVKVQFPWDRYGQHNENSSCWVRVSHQWAGKNWGSIYIPRIGQEVIVDFYDGNPDRPIITGRVYNAEQMPPWGLPANKTQSGILTRSSKEGTAENANWIRFEDKMGEEQLFIHAEKNQDIEVENDETHWVGRDREKTIDRDETVHIKRDRTERVDNNETISIGNDRTEDVGNNETISIVNNRKETVGGNEKVSIAKNLTHSVGQTEMKSVGLMRFQAVGLNETLTVGGMQQSLVGLSRIQKVGGKDSLKVGKTLSIDVGERIEMMCGDSKIVMTTNAIYIDSPNANLLGGKRINIDGRVVNINGSVASAASTEGPDEPEEASLIPTSPTTGSPVQSSSLIKTTVATSAPETHLNISPFNPASAGSDSGIPIPTFLTTEGGEGSSSVGQRASDIISPQELRGPDVGIIAPPADNYFRDTVEGQVSNFLFGDLATNAADLWRNTFGDERYTGINPLTKENQGYTNRADRFFSILPIPAAKTAGSVGDLAKTTARSGSVVPSSPSASSGATSPLGSRRLQMNQPENPSYQPVRNVSTNINGRDYSGHSIDRMQDRGIMPEVVRNTIDTGSSRASRLGTTIHYDEANNVSVVVNAQGKVVTVRYGQ
ncbi:type VI secretion system Vgr family protein [Nitrincola sp. MINF-07-Sa-05]|uniref:type VI secretion system Vgr family protein n=1 Tax=Nitrincola salilacus TaxID=3400273 RepID=UPI00391807DB